MSKYSFPKDLGLLKKAQEFAYECLINTKVETSDMSDVAKYYRYEHSLRVASFGKMLVKDAKKRGMNVDEFVVRMACMLHDIGKFEAFLIPNKSHGLVGSCMARPFLEGLGIDKKTVEDICYCIACHSGDYHPYEYEEIIEAHFVEEADDLDRYGMLRVLAKIGDWRDSSKTMKELIAKIDAYVLRLKNHLKNMNPVSPLAKKLLKKQIKLQINAFLGYRKQMVATVDAEGHNAKEKYCD